MAVQVLPSITRTAGAQDDYPFLVQTPDGLKRDITNDFIEVVVGGTINAVIFSANSGDPTKVEKDDPTNGGFTLHLSPDFLPAAVGEVTRYQIRVTPNAAAPSSATVVAGDGEFTIKAPLFLPPDFVIVPTNLAVSIVAGGNDNQNVDVNSVGNFADSVTLSATVDPVVANGPIASITTPANVPSGGTDTKILSISTVGATPLGGYTVTITGLAGAITHTADVGLTVT